MGRLGSREPRVGGGRQAEQHPPGMSLTCYSLLGGRCGEHQPHKRGARALLQEPQAQRGQEAAQPSGCGCAADKARGAAAIREALQGGTG